MKDAIKKSLKSNMGIVFSVFAVILAVTAAVFIVSAENPVILSGSSTSGEESTLTYEALDYEYNRKNEPVFYKLTANNSGIENMIVPARTDAFIDVSVDETGYYKIFVSEDANTGYIPVISKFDEDGLVVENSCQKENASVLMMHLEEGVHSFGISNDRFDDNAEYYFNAELCDEYIQSFNLQDVIPIDFCTELNLKPHETKVLEIENTKDGYTNFICAEGDGLSVEIFDGNLVSCGYDSSEISERGEICQFVVMREKSADNFFAVVSNDSEKEVTVSYNTDLEVICKECRALKLNTPVSLAEDEDVFLGQGIFSFISDETREYEINFASFTDAEINLIVRDVVDYSEITAHKTGCIENGTLTLKNIALEKGKTYAVIIDSCSEELCNPNVTIK